MLFPDPLIEEYQVNGHRVFAVRDDLCSPFPGPNFSKIRGLYKHLLRKREDGIRTVMSQDTSISRCGWGVSFVAKELEMVHYNVYADRKIINFYQRMSQRLGGVLIPVRGSFSGAMKSQGLKRLAEKKIKPDYVCPTGISVLETLEEHADLISRMDRSLLTGSIIVCVSSGTICAGILYGLSKHQLDARILGVMSSSYRSRHSKIVDLTGQAARRYNTPVYPGNLIMIDAHYEYSKPVKVDVPFPCDLYLDRKAWDWLERNLDVLRPPIVFWNIGGEWDPRVGMKADLKGDGVHGKGYVEEFLDGSE